MTKLWVRAGAGVAVLIGSMVAAQAQEAGLAGLHAWVRAGSKTCMADHFHDGSGTGRSKAQAEAAAIRAWVDFTAWEYGSAWGRYSMAVSKSMRCANSDGGVKCDVQARPCRQSRRGD